MTLVSPVSAPRWYGYFQAVAKTYGAGSPSGRITVKPELSWYGLSSARVLVLTHRETALPDLGDETGRKLHEWVVVVDEEDALPLYYDNVGGIDPDGLPYPAFGVYVKVTYNYLLNGSVSREYLPRTGQYAVQDLLNQPDSHTVPIGLMVSGVREVISHLDSAQWSGPGSMIVYDREASFGWVTRSDAEDFDLARDKRWVPGRAGVYERFLLGSGTLDGWGLYAMQNVLVLELWRSGVLVSSRVLHCDGLRHLYDDPDPRFVIGFGYDLELGRISIGAAGRGEHHSGVSFIEYDVPELRGLQHDQRRVYIGGAPVLYADGTEGHRTAWGHVQPVQGQFTSEGYLTRGGLTQLMQEV